MLREGSCFGETNFAKGTISSQFSVHANTNSTLVVELRRELVRSLTECDPHLGVRFWYTFCKVLNRGLLESMESTFPGTWCMSQVGVLSCTWCAQLRMCTYMCMCGSACCVSNVRLGASNWRQGCLILVRPSTVHFQASVRLVANFHFHSLY